MVWKFRKTAITIPLELHEKIRSSCTPIDEVQSEVVSVRQTAKQRRKIAKPDSDQSFKYRV